MSRAVQSFPVRMGIEALTSGDQRMFGSSIVGRRDADDSVSVGVGAGDDDDDESPTTSPRRRDHHHLVIFTSSHEKISAA